MRHSLPHYRPWAWVTLLLTAVLCLPSSASEPPAADPRAAEGYERLLHKPLSFPAMTTEELDRLWTVWEDGEREKAAQATPEIRRRLTFERYGLIPRPDGSPLPLGYTDDGSGALYPNCLSCHGGKVAGRSIPGLPNSHQDLMALSGDLAVLRAHDGGGDPALARQNATFGIPLNFYKGLTNATMFSIVLGSIRDENLDLKLPQLSQPLINNDIDAPPWWHFKKKERIYCDGMAPKTTRTLMQFSMAPGVSGQQLRSWEDDFELIRAFISSLEPPPYPFDIDQALAAEGKAHFEEQCSRCHGTYGETPTYPNRVVPLEEVGTDPVRLGAISRESKEKYNRSWFANYGKHPVKLDVEGYVAPPLDGIWASAPYLHNGSVPTLYHLFHAAERPAVWKRSEDGYDEQRVGLEVEELEAVPEGLNERQRRTYYDTTFKSHSREGHLFPDRLEPDQKRAVLEYLKTL